MLVLTRKKDQSIVINENIEITILEVQGDQVRIGINAPKDISVHRKEVFMQIVEENRKAAAVNVGVDLNSILKKSENGIMLKKHES